RLAASTSAAAPPRLISLPRTSTCTRGCCFSSIRSSLSCGPSSCTMATPSARMRSVRSGWAGNCGAESSEESSEANEVALLEVGEHMGVHVEHGLGGAGAVVEDQTILAVGVLRRDLLGHADHLGQQTRVTGGELGDVPVLLGGGDHEHVERSLRVDVADREHPLTARDELPGDLA